MKTLYCYRLTAQDCVFGLMTQEELEKNVRMSDLDDFDWIVYFQVTYLPEFIANAKKAFLSKGWDSIARHEPLFFTTPTDQGFALGLWLKQDNNGETFIASEVPLIHLAEAQGANVFGYAEQV